MKLYARFQGNKEINTESVHNDIVEIFVRKDFEDIEDLKDVYYDTLKLRKDVTADELVELIEKCESIDDAEELSRKYKLQGVCCIDLGEYDSVDDVDVEDIEPPCEVDSENYLLIFEGEWIGDCGDGEIVKPTKVHKIIKR